MKQIIPKKLYFNSHLRVIAPARSYSFLPVSIAENAIKSLEKVGFQVSFGKNVTKKDIFNSSSIKDRIEDLHDAFLDTSVDGVLSVIGGYNSNQLLRYIDYEIIKNNPKIFCGYSDISILANAFYFKTGLITYVGPHFSSWGMIHGREYSDEYFLKCCLTSKPYEIKPSEYWSDDPWLSDQENRHFIKNDGFWVMSEGEGCGKSVGGNLSSFNLLFGTEYIDLTNSVIFLEDIASTNPESFDRFLQQIIHQKGFTTVQALIIGRFQKKSLITKELLKIILESKRELKKIPIIANVDIGHTCPLVTMPVGGQIKVIAKKHNCKIQILVH